MTNILQSLYTSQDALRANQAAMSVVSNNIANMNTEGYSKQRIDLESLTFRAGSSNQIIQVQQGTVAVQKVTRYQDEFLNSFIMQENSVYGYDSKSTEILKSLDEYFNEISGSGITGALKSYFSAAQQLSNDPMNKVVRANFIAQADTLATAFNAKYQQLNDYRESLVGDGATLNSLHNSQIGKLTDDINSKIEQITELNRQISVLSTQQGGEPNSLLDKREMLMEDLAKQVPIITRMEGNSLNIYIGNVQIVDEGKQLAYFKATVGNTTDPAVISIMDNETNLPLVKDYKTTITPGQGELKALLDAGSSSVGSVADIIKQLDTLAQEFAKSVNEIQLKRNYDGGGTLTDASLKINTANNKLEYATENIFLNADPPAVYDPTLITAGNIRVNQVVRDNPFEIATAYAPIDILPGPTIVPENADAVGNNNNALAFATMRDTKMLNLGGLTVENNYYSLISSIGNNTSLAKDKLEAQQASLDQLNDKKQSCVGVNLDEELVDLMKYQKAYEASAKIFSVVNEMISVIMNMGK